MLHSNDKRLCACAVASRVLIALLSFALTELVSYSYRRTS